MNRDQAIKTLKDLQYRIQVSSRGDPELSNAIRLRDRLCQRFNIPIKDIEANIVTKRIWEGMTREEAQVIVQYAFNRLKRKNGEFQLYSYRNSSDKKLWMVEIPMAQDEYEAHNRIIKELVHLHRKRRKTYLDKQRAELKMRMEAWDTQFLHNANLLSDAPEGEHREPPWGLREAMAAANDLEDVIFPDHYVESQKKEIGFTSA